MRCERESRSAAPLPNGKEISQQQESPSGGTERCKVSVDGKIAFVADRVWRDAEADATEVASAQTKANPAQATDDKRYLYSGTETVSKIQDCIDRSHPDQPLFTVLQMFAEDREDEDAIERLIVGYTKRAQKRKSAHDGLHEN
ncbi:hypothetical protein GCM10010358_64630 [Streptomyces minutiscleroticus]|uniref:Uncharacterized protein n=1 Tax=Streptomyces minutiscleroticus TaxID=68238 RepID=A0A918U684_9ACTN|nr:hypothetical protein [Streptomyces minutiscleroticus]GGY01732.1 hypothetical protein GCM10010358_64630 [Streptomyces minutiscleroticus]